MPLLVTSASGANGNGYGALLAFDRDGSALGPFSDDSRIVDPRGLALDPERNRLFLNSAERVLLLDPAGKVVGDTGVIDGLNPGGGTIGPDGRYYVGLRTTRTVTAFTPSLDAPSEHILPPHVVPFPRGFAFGRDGRLYLGSRIGPSGEGDNAIYVFDPNSGMRPSHLVNDPDLSPLDMAIAANGNIVVSSEHPFGAAHAVTTVREYDAADGRLVRIFRPPVVSDFRRPRGLRFGPDSNLYCVAQDEVAAFDFGSGQALETTLRFPRLYGQAMEFFP